jgi:hypothetical protein
LFIAPWVKPPCKLAVRAGYIFRPGIIEVLLLWLLQVALTPKICPLTALDEALPKFASIWAWRLLVGGFFYYASQLSEILKSNPPLATTWMALAVFGSEVLLLFTSWVYLWKAALTSPFVGDLFVYLLLRRLALWLRDKRREIELEALAAIESPAVIPVQCTGLSVERFVDELVCDITLWCTDVWEILQ